MSHDHTLQEKIIFEEKVKLPNLNEVRLQFKCCPPRDVPEVLHQLDNFERAASGTWQQVSLDFMEGDLKMVLIRVLQGIHPHKLNVKHFNEKQL